ncbi:MAG: hypothetical protein M3N53_13075 [Actinomycetota bacterium]|nr:hypothetical protein [Actinomycetota bacterium]
MTDPRVTQAWPFKESDRHGWPGDADVTAAGSLAEKLLPEWLSVRTKRTEEEIAENKAEFDADLVVETEYYKAVLSVAQGAIDRARASAEFVEKAAGVIVTIYTAVIAASYSATERPLPPKAMLPAVLLGLSIALAVVYLAYLPGPDDGDEDVKAAEGKSRSQRFTNTFVQWASAIVGERRRWLRAAVISLGLAVILLPAPFVRLGTEPIPGTSASTDWPAIDVVAGSEVALQKILYQAQVDEVVAARAKSGSAVQERYDELWWVALVGSLAAIWLVSGWYPGEEP